jgi:type I restriction enzyme S subunit
MPSEEEQKKIAAFLNSIDENLEKLEIQIQGLRTWKKGLLQQMFV